VAGFVGIRMRHWKNTGACQRLGQIVSYADDFVILCTSRTQARASLAQVSRWFEKLGLRMNPAKTRLCYVEEECFDFLGYTFGPFRHWRTGKKILSAQPSKKSQKKLKEKVNLLLYPGNPTPWTELRARLNRLLTGWAGYFQFGHTAKAYQAVKWHVAYRVRQHLRRRHKLPRGTGRFGFLEVYGPVGVLDLHQVRLRRARACLK
jgi:RNA-directed DNA polymerase